MSEPIIVVDNLRKEYRLGVRMRRVVAVEQATFEVRRGEVFGFVGPNGAGKTTTIRALMGLVRPTAGSLRLFGHAVPSHDARRRLGFLPEAPYFYDYLTARELLDLTGRLFGLDAATRKRRAGELIEKVRLRDAADRPMRKYSKGMLQRAGLAQALMNDPELVVLDEPMSGLDPIGRREVREIIGELARAGKTVFFSTHILPDVEALCDRVAIIARGRVRSAGDVGEVLAANVLGTEVVLAAAEDQAAPPVPEGATLDRRGRELKVVLPHGVDADAWVRALPAGVRLVRLTPRTESLEDLYVRVTGAEGRDHEEVRP